MKRVAVIPARGGSTRLKDKNIHPVNGLPLIQYTIDAVVNSGCFDEIYLSTDSELIAEKALKCSSALKIYHRNEEFANSKVTVLSALLDMMTKIPKGDVFGYFLPTCPFRNSHDIQSAVNLLNSADYVVSVSEFSEPVQLALQKLDDYVIPVFDNLTAGITNSLYMKKFYRPNGGIYLGHWDRILEDRNFFSRKVKSVLIPKERSHDINDIYDIKFAEMLLRDGIIKI